MTPTLAARNLTKTFGSATVNRDISITFKPGTLHAIIGENGAGKTTLLKSLFGLHQPDGGEILLNGQPMKWKSPLDAISHGIGMVQQHLCLVESISALDNIILGAEPMKSGFQIDRKKARARIEQVLPSSQLAVPWEATVESLSLGEKQKIEILKLIYRDSQILFLDEPTAVLTPQEIEDLYAILKKLRQLGKTVVTITHKIHEVMKHFDEYTVLRSGQVTAQGLVANVTEGELVRAMIGRDLNPAQRPQSKNQHEVAFEIRNLQEQSLSRGSLRGVSIRVSAGEIVGIAGVEGSGQQNLVEAILGTRPVEGSIQLFGTTLEGLSTHERRSLGLGLVPGDRHHEGLWLDESCLHNSIIGMERDFSKLGFLDEARIENQASAWAKEFDVRAASMKQSAASLSGGNQQKLIFAREVAGRKPRVLICYQPTRGVDLGAIELIHTRLRALQSQGLAILVISSDLDELTQLSDRISVLFEGKTVADFSPPFDHFSLGRAMTGAQ